jgi:hypothetical protein
MVVGTDESTTVDWKVGNPPAGSEKRAMAEVPS